MRRGLPASLVSGLAVVAIVVGAPAALAQPPNDNFANAQVLTGLPTTATGSNVDATLEPGEPEHGFVQGGTSVWYRWTAPTGGRVTIDTCGSSFDTVLAVYTGASIDALAKVASNDDACGSSGAQSRVRFDAAAGTTYQIAVDGLFDSGTVQLAITPGPFPKPPPVPAPGLYSGRSFFGERISFRLSSNRRRIRGFTIRGVDLVCQRGEVRILKLKLLVPIRVKANGRFSFRRTGRNRMGATQTLAIKGRLLAPRRARGSVRIRQRDRLVGRCRYFAGKFDWTARNRA